MTSINGDMSSGQPADDEPPEYPAHDVLDFIDQTVARITDAEVDKRLRGILGSADHDQHTDLPQQAIENIDFRATRGSSLLRPHRAPFSRPPARQWLSSSGKAASLSIGTGCRLARRPDRTGPRYHPGVASSSCSPTMSSSASERLRGCYGRSQRDPLRCGYPTSQTWTCRTGRRRDTGMTAPSCGRPTGPDYCRRVVSLLV
jgi:hypothetical protein